MRERSTFVSSATFLYINCGHVIVHKRKSFQETSQDAKKHTKIIMKIGVRKQPMELAQNVIKVPELFFNNFHFIIRLFKYILFRTFRVTFFHEKSDDQNYEYNIYAISKSFRNQSWIINHHIYTSSYIEKLKISSKSLMIHKFSSFKSPTDFYTMYTNT